MRIVFSSNISWSIFNFRLNLIKTLLQDGHEIHVVASEDRYSAELIKYGCKFWKLSSNNNTINPLLDILSSIRLFFIYLKIKPAVVCHNAIKPNIYGSIITRLLGIPTINNISGLGTLFIRHNFITEIAICLYKISQRHVHAVFFQNQDDMNCFIKNGITRTSQSILIPGSGVDTLRFNPNLRVRNSLNFQFLFVGRLLFDKGLLEFAEASKLLKEKYPKVDFKILGDYYEHNSSGITPEQMNTWEEGFGVEYLGRTDNVENFMKYADCVVLPSYREGLSKVLLEASSMGIPIITSDVPGCKDVVVNGETGFLCSVMDVASLALQMEKMLLLSDNRKALMGQNARNRALLFFDENIVINEYRKVINTVI
jgi:glycosyltransferase involved in cell wall biosynthesis